MQIFSMLSYTLRYVDEGIIVLLTVLKTLLFATKSRLLLTFAIVALLAGGCAKPPKEPRIIKVEMKKYSVNPAEIRVRQGEAVEVHLTAADVQHGFDVPELGISEPVQPGQVARFAIKTDKKGIFEVTCGIICGPRHDEMRGRIIVE
jgi:heme/copper-type cytochrome/quinol oxidase subunit 2